MSYTGYKVYHINTDKKGFYTIKFDTTACLLIYVFKENYIKHFKEKEVFLKNQKIDFYLDKKKTNK